MPGYNPNLDAPPTPLEIGEPLGPPPAAPPDPPPAAPTPDENPDQDPLAVQLDNSPRHHLEQPATDQPHNHAPRTSTRARRPPTYLVDYERS